LISKCRPLAALTCSLIHGLARFQSIRCTASSVANGNTKVTAHSTSAARSQRRRARAGRCGDGGALGGSMVTIGPLCYGGPSRSWRVGEVCRPCPTSRPLYPVVHVLRRQAEHTATALQKVFLAVLAGACDLLNWIPVPGPKRGTPRAIHCCSCSCRSTRSD